MTNEQRRDPAVLAEDVDMIRLEFHTPFWDSDFLEVVFNTPAELCLGHWLYMERLRARLPEALSVPWQAYPGHEPCPHGMPTGSLNQWSDLAVQARRRDRRIALRHGSRMFLDPGPLLSRTRCLAAMAGLALGIRDTGASLSTAFQLSRAVKRTHGRWDVPPSPRASGSG